MANRRDFIEEIVSILRNRANEIETDYLKLKNKQMSVEEFEEEYRDSLNDIIDRLEPEKDYPNNHCTYVLNDGTEVMSNDYSDDY